MGEVPPCTKSGLKGKVFSPAGVKNFSGLKPRRVEAVIAADYARGFGMRWSTIAYGCNVQLSIYFWP